jgi:hypothetical protein
MHVQYSLQARIARNTFASTAVDSLAISKHRFAGR